MRLHPIFGTKPVRTLNPSQAEAEAGTAKTARVWTAERVKQAIEALDVAQATQSALEAETNEDTYAPPDLIKHSPGVMNFWCTFNGTAAGPITPDLDYNVVDVTDNGTGDYTINIDTDFSSGNYAVSGMAGDETTLADMFVGGPAATAAAGTFRLQVRANDGVLSDPAVMQAMGIGDQA